MEVAGLIKALDLVGSVAGGMEIRIRELEGQLQGERDLVVAAQKDYTELWELHLGLKQELKDAKIALDGLESARRRYLAMLEDIRDTDSNCRDDLYAAIHEILDRHG